MIRCFLPIQRVAAQRGSGAVQRLARGLQSAVPSTGCSFHRGNAKPVPDNGGFDAPWLSRNSGPGGLVDRCARIAGSSRVDLPCSPDIRQPGSENFYIPVVAIVPAALGAGGTILLHLHFYCKPDRDCHSGTSHPPNKPTISGWGLTRLRTLNGS